MVEMCLISAEYPNGLIILKDNYLGKRIILKVRIGIYGNLNYNYSVYNRNNQCTSGGGGGGGSKSNTKDVKKLITDLYTENFIEKDSNSFVDNYFCFSDSEDYEDLGDLEVSFLDEDEIDCKNIDQSSCNDCGETKNI